MAKHLFACLTLLLTASLAFGASVNYGDITVAHDFQPGGQPSHGYTEYRILITNKSSDRTRRVRVEFPGSTFSGPNGGGLRGISRTVSVSPGTASVVSLLQPATPNAVGTGLTVYIDGRKQDDQVQLNPVGGYGHRGVSRRGRMVMYHSSRSGTAENLVLVSQRVGENFIKVPGMRGHWPAPAGGAGMPFAPGGVAPPPPGGVAVDPDPLAEEVEPGGPPAPPPGAKKPAPPMAKPAGPKPVGGVMMGPGGSAIQAIDGQFLRADLPISGWSERWLAYSRYDGIFVTREDLAELEAGTPDVKAILAALWQYVETGGTMVVLGPGAVTVPLTWRKYATQAEGLTIYPCGFGHCVLTPDRISAKWSSNRWQAIHLAITGTGAPWRAQRNLLELNQGFAVVDNLGVPVVGLFTLMILFGIAIGPANLIILSRKNKRIWLLWTVPLLSGLFCVLVMGYMIVAEGWKGHARVAGLTILDENEKRATTIGKTAFYSPMTPGDGLRFSEETEVMAQGNEHPAFSGFTYIDWTGEQHLLRGWVTARVPAHFTMRKSEHSLLRLNLRKEDGGLSVVNGLKADIAKLTLADEKGQLYECGAIVAGASAKLTRLDGETRRESPVKEWRQRYGQTDWAQAIETAASTGGKALLGPGTYVAVLEESPFLEQGMKGATVRRSPSVVVGIMAAEAAK